jgi:hypothetical protein
VGAGFEHLERGEDPSGRGMMDVAARAIFLDQAEAIDEDEGQTPED